MKIHAICFFILPDLPWPVLSWRLRPCGSEGGEQGSILVVVVHHHHVALPAHGGGRGETWFRNLVIFIFIRENRLHFF